MRHLTDDQIKVLKDKLDTMYERVREDIRAELLRADQEQYSDLAGQVNDPGDASVADLLADMNIVSVNRLVRELQEVEAALERIREGTYGICEDSDDPIPFPRLQAYPTARRTVEYQERHEQMHATANGRPATL